ncbi:MAG TPA: hypothetical protein PKY40_14585, partial [Burkholderiaceae bacterium]|nr:hypothetical protein [Burkholderiaceae bacterium]
PFSGQWRCHGALADERSGAWDRLEQGRRSARLSGGGGERARAGGAVQVGVAPQGSAKVPSGTGP